MSEIQVGQINSTDGSTAITVSTGNTTLAGSLAMGANNISFSNGNGIDFSASEGGGASSSVLNDYEEGTWTPTGNNVTFTTDSGQYTKIGDICILSFYITWPSNSSGNRADISGMPFNAAGANQFGGGYISFENTAYTQLSLYLGALDEFRPLNAGTNLTNANLSGKTVIGTLIYKVA